MSHPNRPTAELLAEHSTWMRGLARQLVADAAQADDLAQETLLVALESPPRDAGSLRVWLRRVMRNISRERFRSHMARTAREAATARAEELPATDELVERVHTQRRVADLLLDLEEPYRTTVLLRFYENLPPRKIAARQGVPVATVKSRLQRGLAKLRCDLDDEHAGDRKSWVLALLPWTGDINPIALTTAGGLALNIKLILAASVVATTGVLLWVQQDDESVLAIDALVTKVEAPGSALTAVGAQDAPAPELEVEAERAAVVILPRGEQEAIEVRSTFLVSGRVLDSEGEPVDGVPVRLRGGDGTALTFSGGIFEFPAHASSGSIEVVSDEWVAVRTATWSEKGEFETVVVVARAIRLGGDVVNEWGRGAKGARVSIVMPADFETRFDYPLDGTLAEEWSTRCSADGAFQLERAPAVSGAELRALHQGFEPVVMQAPIASRNDLWIQLRDLQVPAGHALRGVVLHADGSAASNALVAMGSVTVRASDAGLFAIDLDRAGNTARVQAVESGQIPAVMERPLEPEGESTGWPEFVELQFGGAALTISGRVVDEDGEPLEGGRVWVGDASRFGAVGKIPLRLEALAAGGQVPDEAIDSLARSSAEADGDTYGSARPIFQPNALVYWVETESDGAFELPGLSDREYTLYVLDRDMHWGTISAPIPAGARGVELAVATREAFPLLRGTVVTGQGDPVSGVSITPWVPALSVKEPVLGGTADVVRFFLGRTVTTDEAGRFEMRDVPRAHVQFHLVSEEIVPSYASVDQVRDPDEFEIEVLGRVHLEVTVAPGPDGPDAFRVTDVSGEVIPVLRMRADGYAHHAEFNLREGKSGIVTITTNATDLHFLRAGAVVSTVPIHPRPGKTLIVSNE